MTDTEIITALIVAVPTVLTSVVVPIIMFILQAREKARALEIQYRREDELAQRVEKAADKAREEVHQQVKVVRDQSRVNTQILVAQNDALTTLQESVTAIQKNGNGKNGH